MKNKLCFIGILFLFLNCESIFIENISSDSVILLAPSESSILTVGNVQFNWQEVSEATSYNIQLAIPNFENANQVLLDSIVTKTVFIKDLEVGDYQWRVLASNSGYSTGYTTNSFTVN